MQLPGPQRICPSQVFALDPFPAEPGTFLGQLTPFVCRTWSQCWLYPFYVFFREVFSSCTVQGEYKQLSQVHFSVTSELLNLAYISTWAPPMPCISLSSRDKSTERNSHGNIFPRGFQMRSIWRARVLFKPCFHFTFYSFGHTRISKSKEWNQLCFLLADYSYRSGWRTPMC